MRSSDSGLLAGVLGWGYLYRADTVIPLGAFGMGTGMAGLALGVAALPVMGVSVCGADWFPLVMSVTDKFLVFTHYLWGFWLIRIGFSVRLRFSVWVMWLFCGWLGLSGSVFGCLLASLCLVLRGRLLLSMLAGTDG